MSGGEASAEQELDVIEVVNMMRGVARMVRGLYLGLVEEGFEPAEAFVLVGRYLHGTAGGKVA